MKRDVDPPQPGDKLNVIVGPMGCPFCAGSFSIVENQVHKAVTHTLPMCEKFVENDPVDYLAAARHAREGTN